MTERDYKKEYRDFHGKPKQRKARSMRVMARRKKKLGVGDPREVDHKRPLSKMNGKELKNSNKDSNLRVVSRDSNRKKGSMKSALRSLASGHARHTKKRRRK